MWAQLGTGLALGLSLAAPPGPVNALITREAARGGAWAGIRSGYPAPVVDTCYMLLVLVGLPRVVDLHRYQLPLALVGGALMLYLALDLARVRPDPKPLPRGAVWGVTLGNPFQYAWWASAGAAFLAAYGIWGAVGFLAAIYGWVVLYSSAVAHGSVRWSWFAPLASLASADALVAFALLLWAQGAGL